MHPSSPYQTTIYTECKTNPDTSYQILATAGSGKTTTLINLNAHLAIPGSIFLAYNKAIADTLCAVGVNAKTMHSLGLRSKRNKIINARKMENILKYKVMALEDDSSKERLKEFYDVKDYFSKMASLIKSAGVFDKQGVTEELISSLAAHHALDREIQDTFTLREMFSYNHQGKVIDFDDMLELEEGAGYGIHPLVYIDESQDLNLAQVNFLTKITHRIVSVGDPAQSIYGFRGADPEAMDTLALTFRCKRLPLSISYRCPQAVVMEARKFSPYIECSPTAPEGVVSSLTVKQLEAMASPGDFILCRTTAPLVDFFFRLIAEGKSAKVLGKDYCDALEPIVHVLQSKFEFSHYGIQSYWEDKLNQKRDKKHELLRIREKLDILEVIVKLTNGRNPIDTIRGMFSNTSSENCITLSTIHRVKGLEANRVFLIRPDLLPHPSAEQDWEFVQENNLQYVAVTRAKKEFYYVK